MKILVIEDEEQLSEFLKEVLEKEHFNVTLCPSIEEALKSQLPTHHDMILLDLMLPGRGGEHLVRELRRQKRNIPIIVVSALSQISTKIEMMNLGADDYVTKPFDVKELIARINALYRRYLKDKSSDKETYGDITFYWKQNKVVREGKTILLTKKEGELLQFLLENRGLTVRIEDILMRVWQAKVGFTSNVVQSTIRRLRRKIDADFKHKLIRNVHGIGYVLILPDDSEYESE